MFGLFRFILAFNVVLFHLLKVPVIGMFAVYSFFMLSGFLMTSIMHRTYGYTYHGVKTYYLNRVLRLYPIYWVLLIVSFLIFQSMGMSTISGFHSAIISPITATDYFSNVFFIYPLFEPVNYPVRILPATWALTIEVCFYFLMGLGLSKSKKITLVWFALSCVYVVYVFFNTGQYVAGYGNILSASLPFSLGALIYFYNEQIYTLLKKMNIRLMYILLAFVANLLLVSVSPIINEAYFWKIGVIATYANMFLSFILIIFLLFEGKNYFTRKIDTFFGDLSYPVYLFHITGAVIASFIVYGEINSNNPSQDGFVFMLGVLITIIVSVVVNYIVSDKVEKIRTMLKKT